MSPEEVIKIITERVKDTANVSVVFGDPVESGGVTVIPVATVKVAGGGGGGRGKSLPVSEGEEVGSETGMGMGLQISAKPLGYIEVKEGSAKLVPIVDATKVAVFSLITATLSVMAISKMFVRRAKAKQE